MSERLIDTSPEDNYSLLGCNVYAGFGCRYCASPCEGDTCARCLRDSNPAADPNPEGSSGNG